jgi:uncharacterized protein (UPF0333 family)
MKKLMLIAAIFATTMFVNAQTQPQTRIVNETSNIYRIEEFVNNQYVPTYRVVNNVVQKNVNNNWYNVAYLETTKKDTYIAPIQYNTPTTNTTTVAPQQTTNVVYPTQAGTNMVRLLYP